MICGGTTMTIQEIAALANVSTSTVSKIVNGKDKDISEATRQRVLKIIEENNYVPYSKYRKKEHMRQRLIGVILKDAYSRAGQMLRSIEQAVTPRGYNLISRIVDGSPKSIADAIQAMKHLNISGLLIYSDQDLSEYTGGLNTIYITENSDFSSSQGSTFYLSLYDAGKMAAARLVSEGHTRISCIVLKEQASILYGAEEALRRYGESCLMEAWRTGKDLDDIITDGSLEDCINDSVTAVISGSPEITRIVCDYASSAGICIPHTLSIISIGDETSLKYTSGGITAVELPFGQMAEKAALYLLDTISQRKSAEATKAVPLSLIDRRSISPPAPVTRETNILVVGSLNMDTTLELTDIPVDGETQIAGAILTLPGGSGGNQAVGSGKLGGNVSMIGRLGKDPDGRLLYKSLTNNQVNVEGIELDSISASGKAFVYIDKDGENTIVVYPGANLSLDARQLIRHEILFEKSNYCLLSLEISAEAAASTIQMCHTHGVQVMLKPSAVDKLDSSLLSRIHYLIPNERELHKIIPGGLPLEEKTGLLLEKGVKNVIVTLGKRGCYLRTPEHSVYFPSAPFTAVDTTGGADSFISALAVCLSQGRELIYSIVYATYAAGITITRYGVQEALPDRKTIDIYKSDIEKMYKKIISQEKAT